MTDETPAADKVRGHCLDRGPYSTHDGTSRRCAVAVACPITRPAAISSGIVALAPIEGPLNTLRQAPLTAPGRIWTEPTCQSGLTHDPDRPALAPAQHERAGRPAWPSCSGPKRSGRRTGAWTPASRLTSRNSGPDHFPGSERARLEPSVEQTSAVGSPQDGLGIRTLVTTLAHPPAVAPPVSPRTVPTRAGRVDSELHGDG